MGFKYDITDLLPNKLNNTQYLQACYCGLYRKDLGEMTQAWYTENKPRMQYKGVDGPALVDQIAFLAQYEIGIKNLEDRTFGKVRLAIVKLLINVVEDERFIKIHTKAVTHNNKGNERRDKRPKKTETLSKPSIESTEVRTVANTEVDQVLKTYEEKFLLRFGNAPAVAPTSIQRSVISSLLLTHSVAELQGAVQAYLFVHDHAGYDVSLGRLFSSNPKLQFITDKCISLGQTKANEFEAYEQASMMGKTPEEVRTMTRRGEYVEKALRPETQTQAQDRIMKRLVQYSNRFPDPRGVRKSHPEFAPITQGIPSWEEIQAAEAKLELLEAS